jgi:SAM-dependent methyltransferase
VNGWHETCRICKAHLGRGSREPSDRALWMGRQPLANALQPTRELAIGLDTHPLEVLVCPCCTLAQLSVAVERELLFGGDYAYQTPASTELSEHYITVNNRIECLDVPPHSFVVDVGSNNGEFLLQMPWWAKTKLGVEPSINVGEIARKRGVETIIDFFCLPVARSIRKQFGVANVVVLRHCLAHVDDMHEIIESAVDVLDDDGILYIENAYWPATVANAEYGQIYHEHMSYLTVQAAQELLHQHGMKIVDVDLSPVHGGSIMIYADKKGTSRVPTRALGDAIATEVACKPAESFLQKDVEHLILKLRHFVDTTNKSLFLYGASAKASTMVNAAGISKRIAGALDASPIKQGKFMPGSGIEIMSTELLKHIEDPVNSICLLSSSTYQNEILQEQKPYIDRGGQFVSLVGKTQFWPSTVTGKL